MKRLLSLLLTILLLPCAFAEDSEPEDERLRQFYRSIYAELSMSEIPEGELTEDLLRDLSHAQADRLLDSILPWLVEKEYIRELPRTAYLNVEGALWKEMPESFWDLSPLVESTPAEELPLFPAHLNPLCAPVVMSRCNYFAMFFLGVETLFGPCPDCFPAGWVYEYYVVNDIEEANRMQITLRHEAEPYDLPSEITLHFDHETDECVCIAVQYHGQDYVIVYQDDSFAIDGMLDFCPYCDDSETEYISWSYHEPGVWHCNQCGIISRLPQR